MFLDFCLLVIGGAPCISHKIVGGKPYFRIPETSQGGGEVVTTLGELVIQSLMGLRTIIKLCYE